MLRVPRGAVDLERPWRAPAGAATASLVDATDGSAARLRTTVSLFHDATNLYALFEGEDDAVVATLFDRDAPLYEEDVFELFIAPQRLEEYFEFEVSPRGSLFDARVESPERHRRTMNVERHWDSRGFSASVRIDSFEGSVRSIASLITIPLADIAPHGERSWRANFYRIDRHPRGDSYLAWSPTLRRPADFHVPDAFGIIEIL